MGRIEDLRREAEEAEKAPAPEESTATAVLETPAAPAEQPAAGENQPAAVPDIPAAAETISKSEYDKVVDFNAKLMSDLERMRASNSTLQGMIKAEAQKVKDLTAQVAAAPTVTAGGNGGSAAATSPELARITEEYGDDFGSVLKQMQAKIDSLEGKLASKPAQPAATVAEPASPAASPEFAAAPVTATSTFISDLTKAYPNWVYINGYGEGQGAIPENPQWPIFLAQKDPVTGLTRKQLLDIHVNSNNVEGTISLFRAFTATAGGATPTGDITKGAEKFVDPATTAGGPPPVQGNQPTMLHGYNINSMADFDRFKSDRIRRRIDHLTSAEVQAIANGFDAADTKGLLR